MKRSNEAWLMVQLTNARTLGLDVSTLVDNTCAGDWGAEPALPSFEGGLLYGNKGFDKAGAV